MALIRALSSSGGGGGNNSIIYVYAWSLYSSGDTRTILFTNYDDDYQIYTYKSCSYSDENVTFSISNNAGTITFHKPATVTNGNSKTVTHKNANDTYTVSSDNGASQPIMIVMD